MKDRIIKLYERPIFPAILTFLILSVLVLSMILSAKGDPLVLVRVGTRFSEGDPSGTTGYDGQFVYYIAQDLNPASVADHLDNPAYRYQRILLPLLARFFSLGSVTLLPWVLAIIGVVSQSLGTWGVGILFKRLGISPWYALIYGLWAGFVLAVMADLPEPLAYALLIAAILAQADERYLTSGILYALAIFAKDVVLFFVAAQAVAYFWKQDFRRAIQFSLVAILPFVLFQGWLYFAFGSIGIGVGGEGATPFEWIPLMGFWRIGSISPSMLKANLIIFGPSLIFPTLWSLYLVWKKSSSGEINFVVLSLAIQGILILALPFAVARNPGGLLRFMCGFVTALLLFCAHYRNLRALRLMSLWLVLNVFLLKG